MFIGHLPIPDHFWKPVLYLLNLGVWGHFATSIVYYRKVIRILEDELGNERPSLI
jgi:hypothetical protein